jgi:tetratricopeptide (TPR) repeat protein
MKREAPPADRARGFRSSAFLEMYEGRYAKAIAQLREAILLNRSHQSRVSEYRDRGILQIALRATGQRAAAAAEWKIAEQLGQQLALSPEWLWRSAQYMARAGRESDAFRIIGLMEKTARDATAASAANRNTARDEGFITLARAELELARGHEGNAIGLLEKVNATLQIPEALEALAVAFRSAGRQDDAVRSYEELLRVRPLGIEAQEQWFQTHVDLARLYERRGELGKARALYNSLLEMWKEADRDLPLLREARQRLAKLPS